MMEHQSCKFRERHLSYATKFSVACSVASMVILAILSSVTTKSSGFGSLTINSADRSSSGRDLEEIASYSAYSCRLIHEMTEKGSASQCTFAKTCDGEGLWAPIVFCSSRPIMWTAILIPVMFVWLVVLFRMLGSTAEDFFSPSLEMFSTRLGLPPRFAGVTLLALGNGAADVSATQSAITGDPQNGYQLSLGALTGAAMMIGCVVSALVILTNEGIPCRGALVRDVTALLVTIAIVWGYLSSGYATPEMVSVFFVVYFSFVLLVLVSDIYHRSIVVRRLVLQAQERERQRQMDEANEVNQNTGNSTLSHVITALSNYDNNEAIERDETSNNGWGVESDDLEHERPIMLHGKHGILSHHHSNARRDLQANTFTPDNINEGTNINHNSNYSMLEDLPIESDDLDSTESRFGASVCSCQKWCGVFNQAKHELNAHFKSLLDDVFWNADVTLAEKFLLTIEIPFVVLRQCTVAIPCEGYYVRSLVSLTLALSPFWAAFYLWHSNQINVFFSWVYYIYWGFFILAAVAFARFGPVQDNISMLNPLISVAIALYGFAIAATWIDSIADALVSLLNFIGILLNIPSSVLGLTLLAWGNSMSDLSANIAMTRKGLANMAMTACFAGPVFNILVGLGFGFSALAAQTGQRDRPVVLSPSVLTGFIFIATNCLCFLITGIFLCRARIPKMYGYFGLTLYTVYIITSITLQYS